MLGSSEIQFIVEGLRSDVRSDGRQKRQWRDFDLQIGVAPHAQGSAQVNIDGTEIVVGVSCSVVECSRSKPAADGSGDIVPVEEGSVRLELDVSPSAVKGNSQGSNGGNAAVFTVSRENVDLAKLRHVLKTNLHNTFSKLLCSTQTNAAALGDPLTRVMTKESESALTQAAARQNLFSCGAAACNLSELYVGSGHCIELVVDVSVLGVDGGNLYGATSLAVKAALMDTKLPNVTVSQGVDGSTSISIDNDPLKAKCLSSAASLCPLLGSFVVHDGCYALDPTLEEEMLPTQVLVAITPTEDGNGDLIFAETALPLRSTPVVSQSTLCEDMVVLVEEGTLLVAQLNAALVETFQTVKQGGSLEDDEGDRAPGRVAV